ncbi:hypothetical protein MSC49_42120 (plasmid) [Methylosinus sp. C49]|uniref:STAS domain-containing protein n=1 Tax=Methylosinus sp. C49 TaxID=2699395 RepID=UPI001366C70B|nr:STAS domain-containing protein [Methylosinus sp. C49]BBU64277.1 hypothetical protein MSC49_42120 [Methylosinus sp. C49]
MSRDPAIVDCVGKLTISESTGIREAMLAAIDRCDDVVIDCSGASEIDLTFIQLLIASRRTAMERGRSVRISAAMDSLVAETSRRAGFVAEDIITTPSPEQ